MQKYIRKTNTFYNYKLLSGLQTFPALNCFSHCLLSLFQFVHFFFLQNLLWLLHYQILLSPFVHSSMKYLLRFVFILFITSGAGKVKCIWFSIQCCLLTTFCGHETCQWTLGALRNDLSVTITDYQSRKATQCLFSLINLQCIQFIQKCKYIFLFYVS